MDLCPYDIKIQADINQNGVKNLCGESQIFFNIFFNFFWNGLDPT